MATQCSLIPYVSDETSSAPAGATRFAALAFFVRASHIRARSM